MHAGTPAPRLHHLLLNKNALDTDAPCCHRVHAQASQAGGGRVIEQQKQQKKRQQEQTGGSESRVSSLSLDLAGAVSVNSVEARVPSICAHSLWCCRFCWLFSHISHAHPLCLGRTAGGRACRGKGYCGAIWQRAAAATRGAHCRCGDRAGEGGALVQADGGRG